MKKNMRKKALLPALSMLLASVIALSGVTYAWFTTANTANVSNLDVNVQAANGIQVSLDATSWRSLISADDIKSFISNPVNYATHSSQYPSADGVEIAPVSTAGVIEDGKMVMYFGGYNEAGNLATSIEKEEARLDGGNFVAFDLFFKSGSEQVLSLDAVSNVKGTSSTGNSLGTEKAVRVAFIPLGSATTANAAKGLKGDASTTAKIWEPNADTRIEGSSEAAGKLAYNGVNKEFNKPENSVVVGEDVVAVNADFTPGNALVTLKSGITKVRVYIWLEGQDVDCVNQISYGDFVTNLQFSVPEAEEGQ